MKINILEHDHPWITWPVHLANSVAKDKEILLTTIPDSAGVNVVNLDLLYDDSIDHTMINNEGIILVKHADYVDMHKAKTILADYKSAGSWYLLFYSLDILRKYFDNTEIKQEEFWFWKQAARFTDKQKTTILTSPRTTSDFIWVGDAEDPRTNVAMVCKSFLYATSEQVHDTNLNIVSHTELPFKPFNNIQFLGLQPNPILFKLIYNSKALIYSSDKTEIPTAIIEALSLGTPVLVKETESILEEGLDIDPWCFWKTEEELVGKIQSLMKNEYTPIIKQAYVDQYIESDPSVMMKELVLIMKREFGND